MNDSYEPQKRLTDLVDRLIKNKSISDSSVLDIMIYTRMITEKNKKYYKHIQLYANWCAHSELTKTCNILRDLDRIYIKFKRLDPGLCISEISKFFGFHELRKELIEVFQDSEIDTNIFDGLKNWLWFCNELINRIHDRPLMFPPDDQITNGSYARNIIDEIKKYRSDNNERTDIFVRKILIIDKLKSGDTPTATPGWNWKIILREDASLIGDLQFTENPSDFKF